MLCNELKDCMNLLLMNRKRKSRHCNNIKEYVQLVNPENQNKKQSKTLWEIGKFRTEKPRINYDDDDDDDEENKISEDDDQSVDNNQQQVKGNTVT